MKKSLLLLLVCLFGVLGGVKAYTVDDLIAAGWTEVTSTEVLSSGANNNVYVLVDAGASTYFVTRGSNLADRPKYVSLVNPFANPGAVWTLESRGTNKYAMQNIASRYYLNSSANGYDDFMDPSWTKSGIFDFAYSSRWDITNSSVVIGQWSPGQYMGPWDGGLSVTHEQNVACNKDNNNAPGFKIYSISRSNYAKKYLQQAPNLAAPVDVTFLIVNPNIYQGGAATDLPTGWVNFGEPNVDSDGKYTNGTGDSKLYAKKTASADFFHTDKQTLYYDYYQTIYSLPGGKYKSKANTFAPKSDYGKSYFYILTTDTPKDHTEMRKSNAWSDGKIETPSADALFGSSLNIGIEANFQFEAWNTTHTSIAQADDFELQVDPYISSMATEFNNGVEMTAGLWYHFTVANTGNHILTATNLNDIIYATGETTALSAAGSSKFSELQTLSANTDYYIRSSSNNTLTITPCISTKAEELPDNGAMTAGDWYYFDVATAGHYDVVATSLANIVYTTNGDLAVDASVASKFSVKNNELSATRYYVKSSSAQTLKWFLTDEKDYTSYITNPSFEVGNKTGWIDETAGRGTPESRDDKIDVISTDALPGKDGAYFAERWWWDSYMNIHQTTQELPAGIYRITALAKADAGEIVIFGKAGNNDEVTQAVHSLSDYSLEVCLATSGTITLGLKGNHNSQTHVAFDNFRLTYVGPYHEIIVDEDTHIHTYEGTFTEDVDFTPTAECPIVDITGASFTGNIDVSFAENPNGLIIATSAQKIELNYLKEEPVKNIISTKDNLSDKVVITDGYPFVAPFDFQAQEARYSRTVGASTNFGTICVPFALTSNKDIQYYTTDQIAGGVLKLAEVNNVAAGTPAIFKKKNSGATSISVHTIGTAIEKDAGSQGESVTLKGTFERITIGTEGATGSDAANGKYYINSSNQFCEGKDWFYVGAFRAYLEAAGNNAARLSISVNDEATAINELKTLDEKQGLKDGKYLIDGKIIVVKEGKQFNVNGVIK